MKFLLVFTILSLLNVIFSTARSFITVKGDKGLAAVISGAYFAFYNVMLIYTVMDFSIIVKCAITFICNVIGVYIVKFVEEKHRAVYLWKIEATVKSNQQVIVREMLSKSSIPYNYIEGVDEYTEYTIFNVFCATKLQSEQALGILEFCNAKYFVSESKLL